MVKCYKTKNLDSYYLEMNYTEIEIEGMKEILQDKEEQIKKLEEELRSLKSELEIRKATAKDYARLQ